MKRVIVAVMMGFALCGNVMAEDSQESITIEKRGRKQILKITGRIKSRHVSYRKGKSVRAYYIVTPDMIKVPLPRSHVEHRDGTISGINLRTSRGKNVNLVCEGRAKDDPKKGMVYTVKKIISLGLVKK
jgi:hypothetical protein